MKHSYVVAGALAAALLCICLAGSALAAPQTSGSATGMQVSGGVPGLQVVTPDLVITQMAIISSGNGEFPTGTLRMTVKNIGKSKAGACMAGVIWTTNLTADPLGRLVCKLVPALAAGASTNIDFNFEAINIPWMGMFIAAVDVPMAGLPKGRMNEVGKENNNGFAFSFDITSITLPHAWTNPGAK